MSRQTEKKFSKRHSGAEMNPLRIGLVGLHNHYHALPFADELLKGIDGMNLVAVSDERESLVRKFGEERLGGDWTLDSYALIKRDDIDAVIITSYTAAHADQVEFAATHGKHVLLDKPIATTMADADRIVAASKKVKVMMAYLLRFIPAYREAYQALKKGAIGKPVSGFYSIRVPAEFIKDHPGASGRGWYADPVKGGGGGFLDHAVHFTDFFRWFFDSDPVSATATIGNLTYPELKIDDYGVAIYTLASGAIVTVESTWHAAGWFAPMTSPDRCTINGTRGEIELHYQKSPQLEIQGIDEPWVERRYVDYVGPQRYEVCYRDLLIEFRDFIRENREPTPGAADGRAALEMVLAAYESNRMGARVKFPLDRAQSA
jgi:predicted dehydrogenase